MMMVGGCARGVNGRAVPVADPRPVGFIEFADAGFSITAPPGWTVRDDSDELIYGDVALTKKGDDASMILIECSTGPSLRPLGPTIALPHKNSVRAWVSSSSRIRVPVWTARAER